MNVCMYDAWIYARRHACMYVCMWIMRHISLLLYVKDEYFLTIGYHQLQGKKVALKKPLVVLQKKKQPQDEASIDLDDDSGTQYPKQTPQKVELHVIGVIRHKLLFKTRPKALIST